MSFLKNLFGSNERVVSKLQNYIDAINGYEPEYEKLSDEELKNKSIEFKNRLDSPTGGETLDDLLPEAFAAVREASKRTNGERHFDVQLVGGIVLHQGKIAEMRTGEGKTLVASLALYLNALEGKGAHLITTNDYLSKIGAGWMAPIFHSLGLSVAAIGHEQSLLYDPESNNENETDSRLAHFRQVSRKEAYAADITYGTNNEFGFDYLRDNMAPAAEYLVQRDLNFAIVDEVDSILIDEARTPLIISAPAEESAAYYQQFADLVPRLKEGEDVEIDEKMRATTLTDQGIAKMESWLNVKNIYGDPNAVALAHHLDESLKAEFLFKLDKDYVVKENEIVIVDEFTGRLMPGRRYSGGLHQAIEAKEHVEIKKESDTLATISFQNLFRMYNKLSGMTGTAATEAEEFFKIYKLDVVEIPTHREVVRIDNNDKVYKTEEAKLRAIVNDIKNRSEKGQPVLVGTISVEKSERLSKYLKREGVKHEVLNAKQHEREGKVISNAGKPGAVTVATNMAGRGVDILLGGAKPRLSSGEAATEKDKKLVSEWERMHQEVIELGGLYVIGTERHEARRIDNQLRGRAGRQGDPGESQFYASMDDDLMRIFGGDRMKNLMNKLRLPDDMPIEHSLISRSIEQSQKRVEGHNFDIRKHLVDYDDVVNKHREVIYRKRKKILTYPNEEDQKKNNLWLHQEVLEMMSEDEKRDYEKRSSAWGDELTANVERAVYLRTIDMLWVEHLNIIDELREGIGLRGYGQRDPLVEYKEEAYNLFQGLTRAIEDRVIEMLLKIEVSNQPQQRPEPIRRMMMQGPDESMAGGSIQNQNIAQKPIKQTAISNSDVQVSVRSKKTGQETSSSSYSKVGRNDACPCGSGKKYKKCCGN
ncbi:MAG: preprotein translocase subunit SecA [Patescibacteria group bacterium]